MIAIDEKKVQTAAQEGMDAFIGVFTDAYKEVVGEAFEKGGMDSLTAEQHTLLAYHILRDELTEGGFCQLIQNGYGGYIFNNPFARMLKQWGLTDLGKLLYKAKEIYIKNRADLERERSDEEFMAMYEQYSAFDKWEELFIENEELFTAMVASYVDDHLPLFAELKG